MVGGGMSDLTEAAKAEPETIILDRFQLTASIEALEDTFHVLSAVPVFLEKIADNTKMEEDIRATILRITAKAVQTELTTLRIGINRLGLLLGETAEEEKA
jgi:signal transduction histidine kinase